MGQVHSSSKIKLMLEDPNSGFQEHPDPNLKDHVLVPKSETEVYGFGKMWEKVDGVWTITDHPESFDDKWFLGDFLRCYCYKLDGYYVYGFSPSTRKTCFG